MPTGSIGSSNRGCGSREGKAGDTGKDGGGGAGAIRGFFATDFFTTAAFTGRRLATVRDCRFAFTFFAGAGLAAFRAGAALRFGTGFLFVFATAFGFRFNAAFFLARGLAAFFARLLALLVLGFAADFFLAGALFAPRFGAVFFFVAMDGMLR